MNLTYQALGSLLEQSGYERARDNNYPILSITMKQGLVDQSDKFKKRIASYDTSKYRVAYKNELVVGFPIDEGVLGFQTKYPAGIVSPAYDIWKLKDETKIHIPYLERYLRSHQARALYASKMQGAVARRRSLTKSDFLKLEIPVPLHDDQIRIATLLSRVETLIDTRKDNLRLLDEFLKSTFLEMFGILHADYKRWTPHKLSELAEIVSGATKGKKYKDEEMVEAPYMRVANVQDGHLNLNEIKTIFVSESEFKRYLLKKGDILLTEGGDPDKLGRGSVWEEQIKNCIHQNHIFRVRITNKKLLNPYFLSALAGSVYGKTYFLKAAKQTTGIASINSTQLKNFPLFLPPIESQNQFAAIVEKVESLKNHYQQNLTELESLYGALSQKAFKGELDLSLVPLTESIMPSNNTHPAVTNVPADTDIILAEKMLDELRLINLELPRDLQVFFEYFINKQVGIFSLDNFWQNASQYILEFMDEDSKPLGVADYDKVKQLLFDLIKKGKISQHFNETTSLMELSINP